MRLPWDGVKVGLGALSANVSIDAPGERREVVPATKDSLFSPLGGFCSFVDDMAGREGVNLGRQGGGLNVAIYDGGYSRVPLATTAAETGKQNVTPKSMHYWSRKYEA